MFDDIDEVLNAFKKYGEARREHDEAADEYDGYSWGYHGAYLQDAVDEAGKEAKAQLDKYIDARITAALAK